MNQRTSCGSSPPYFATQSAPYRGSKETMGFGAEAIAQGPSAVPLLVNMFHNLHTVPSAPDPPVLRAFLAEQRKLPSDGLRLHLMHPGTVGSCGAGLLSGC